MQEEQVIQQLPLDQVVSRPQVRREFDEAALNELATTIKSGGLQQPIRVRREGKEYVIVVGERRWRACKLAGLATVPAIVIEGPMSAAEILQAQLIENLQRADLSVREKAAAISQPVSESECTAAEVAPRLGLSAASVSKLLAVNELPEPILAAVDAGTISLSAAYELSQVTDPARQAELATRAAAGALTRDELAGERKAARAKRAPTPVAPTPTRAVAALGGGRVVSVAAAALTLETFIECLEDLLARARKARLQGLLLATFLKMLKDQSKE